MSEGTRYPVLTQVLFDLTNPDHTAVSCHFTNNDPARGPLPSDGWHQAWYRSGVPFSEIIHSMRSGKDDPWKWDMCEPPRLVTDVEECPFADEDPAEARLIALLEGMGIPHPHMAAQKTVDEMRSLGTRATMTCALTLAEFTKPC